MLYKNINALTRKKINEYFKDYVLKYINKYQYNNIIYNFF